MIRQHLAIACIALTLGTVASHAEAQGPPLDTTGIALTYHKASGDPLDMQLALQYDPVVRAASNFDHDAVVKTETARLQSALNASDTTHEFVIRVNDNISEYDHARGEFSIVLFEPGYSVPFDAFGQRYQIVFANAGALRAIPMPEDAARKFDASLNSFGRRVVDEIHFKVVGAGDPAGAVTGQRIVRAIITAARIMDPNGKVVATPNAASAAAKQQVAAFDIATADVAGLKVGTKSEDLIATLKRLYGDVTTEPIQKPKFPGLAGTLTVNDMGCFAMPGSREPARGSVCVTAEVDQNNIVRTIQVARVFPWMEEDVFREALVQRYGPVAGAHDSSIGFVLGWGPTVPAALVYDDSGPQVALTAEYMTNSSYMGRYSGHPPIRVVMKLVDAGWAAAAATAGDGK
jgi:hypothetical protein